MTNTVLFRFRQQIKENQTPLILQIGHRLFYRRLGFGNRIRAKHSRQIRRIEITQSIPLIAFSLITFLRNVNEIGFRIENRSGILFRQTARDNMVYLPVCLDSLTAVGTYPSTCSLDALYFGLPAFDLPFRPIEHLFTGCCIVFEFRQRC